MKTIMGALIGLLCAAGVIYIASVVSPDFRNTYTSMCNDWQRTVHTTIEDKTGVDLPYTQFTADGYITVVK